MNEDGFRTDRGERASFEYSDVAMNLAPNSTSPQITGGRLCSLMAAARQWELEDLTNNSLRNRNKSKCIKTT